KNTEIALGIIVVSFLLVQGFSAIRQNINPKQRKSTYTGPEIIRHSWSFCPNFGSGYTIPLTYLENPRKQSLAQMLEFSTSSIRIESKSADLNDGTASARVLDMLKSKPRTLASFPMWAEATQFDHNWVIGTLDSEKKMMIEIAGRSACVKDSEGRVWFFRNAKYDMWK
ncbi:MAG: hypothetical protein ABL962_11920, partial [Fimbriimonadaceae bacterium]